MHSSKDYLISNWISKDNPEGFDPAEYIDLTWSETEWKTVIGYLKSFEPIIWSPGVHWCRFRCKKKVILGPYIYDDGYFTWSNELTHYVENHFFKLGEDFIKHIFERKHLIKPEFLLDSNTNYHYIKDLANKQRSFLTPGFGGELWLIPSKIKANSAILKFFRQFDGLYNLSTKSLVDYIKSDKKLLLEKKFDYADYTQLDKTAKDLGIILDFVEKD